MAFQGIMMIGLAMNLLGGLFRPKPPAMNPSYLNSFNNLSKTMSKHSADLQKMWDRPRVKTFDFSFDAPDPPQGAVEKFAQMQQQHDAERTAFLKHFQGELNQAKEEFFAKNHYKTEKGPDGKYRVALKNGKPVVQKGKETTAYRVARQSFEATTKAEMFARHYAEKQQFVKTQKQQLMTFLDGNKFQLANPGVQSELSKLIMESKKKALNLQREHEEEFYKIDLPSEKMVAMVDEKMEQYRQLEREQMMKEENSPQARELAAYQQDLVALLDAKRAEAREKKKSEMFLRDPRKVIREGPKVDLASVLPMNLVSALEEFDITELPA